MGLKNDRSLSNATVEDRKRTRLDAYGFPRGYLFREKQSTGFATGDMVLADVLSGKKKGISKGRVAVRKSGSFNLQTIHGVIQGISWKYCCLLQRADGYSYQYKNGGGASSSDFRPRSPRQKTDEKTGTKPGFYLL